MPQFTYTARSSDGQPRSGTLTSSGQGQAVSDLRGRGWIVLDVQAEKQKPTGEIDLASPLNPANWIPVTRFDIELGMQQLATMIRSGLSLLTAIKTASEQVRRPAMRRVWERIYGQIESGSSFADAIATERRYFPPLVVQLVRVGESSGTLDTVLGQAAEHLERTRALITTLLTALMYPLLVLLLALVVAAYVVIIVIPKLEKFIIHQGRRLPPLTQSLIDSTNWFNSHLVIILCVILIGVICTIVAHRLPASRLKMDAMLLRVPVVGGVLRLAGTALMSRGMALLLVNGITLLDALQITKGLLANRAMQRRLEITRQSVIEGQPLADSLLEGREFLPMLGRMAAVGEATGMLDNVLNEVARFHESQLAGTVKRLSLFIEPVIIVVVGGIVGFVYIAFFLALFSAGGAR